MEVSSENVLIISSRIINNFVKNTYQIQRILIFIYSIKNNNSNIILFICFSNNLKISNAFPCMNTFIYYNLKSVNNITVIYWMIHLCLGPYICNNHTHKKLQSSEILEIVNSLFDIVCILYMIDSYVRNHN